MTANNQLFKETVESEQKPLFRRVILIAIIFVAIVGAFFLFKGEPKPQKQVTKVRDAQKLVKKINNLDSQIKNKQDQIVTLVNEYKKQTGKNISSANMMNLSAAEKKVLEDRIKNEKEVSIKSLLNDIVKKNEDISKLHKEMRRIEAMLPQPHVVARGDNHYRVAINFLAQERGIDKEKAKDLVERAALFDYLIPGFKVWNFYDEKEFGTFVTQGTASVSPNTISRREKKKLVDARDKALTEKDALSYEIEDLEERKQQLLSQIAILDQEKSRLQNTINQLSNQNTEQERILNSLHYVLDVQSNLKKRGILKAGFLRGTRLMVLPGQDLMNILDLRENDMINIAAADYQLKQINDIVMYPKYFKKGKDYSVVITKNKQHASLTIIEKEKLRNEKVIIGIN